jgi:hypothetical protein
MRRHAGPPRRTGSRLSAVSTVVFAVGLAWVLLLNACTESRDQGTIALPTLSAVPTSTPDIPRRVARLSSLVIAASPQALAAPKPLATLAGPGALVTTHRSTIAGFADTASAAEGQRVTLYVTTPAPLFDVEVYRLGWYAGGAEFATLINRVTSLAGIVQPRPTIDPSTGLIAATNWAPNGSLIASHWPTGLYLLKLIATDGDQTYVPLVVRDDTGHHDFLFVHASGTDQAYNGWGGKSLYDFNSSGANTLAGSPAAVEVSFDRPFDQDGSGGSLRWELNMVRWLEENAFDVGYVADVDMARLPEFAARAGAILIVGHSEYWSKEMRDALEQAHQQGKGLGFLSADTGAWAVRFQNSSLGSARIEVGYKNAPDPAVATDPAHSTGHWRDPPLNRPTHAFFGVGTGTAIRQSGDWVVRGVADAPNLFAGTGFSNGDVVHGLIGYEYDGMWTPGAGQTVLDGLRILGVSRVATTVQPDSLLSLFVQHSFTPSAQALLGTFSTNVETLQDNPTWQMMVHLRGQDESAYLVYAAGPTALPVRQRVNGEDYGSFALGAAFYSPGWHTFERDLRADYIAAFGASPPDDLRVDAVILRGSMAITAITLGAEGGDPLRVDTNRVLGGTETGWRITSGSGTLRDGPDGPGEQPALSIQVDIPGGHRADEAQTVFVPRGGSGGPLMAAGSIQWSWALDGLDVFGKHVDDQGNPTPVDPRLQAFTRNLLHALLPAS